MQTHGRKESSWELSLKHSIKLLCNNVSETEELMQKAGSVGAPEWETVSPSCGTHKGFTVVHKCDVAKTQNTGFPLHHQSKSMMQMNKWIIGFNFAMQNQKV